MPLTIQTDRHLVTANRKARRRLLVQVIAPEAPLKGKRTPLDLALILDRSGSMDGEKLDLARQGAIRAVRSLRGGDNLSVVVYDDGVETLLPLSPVSTDSKRKAEKLIQGVRAGGSTALHDGWLTGAKEIRRGQRGNSLSRALLLTDGLANVGEQDPDVLVKQAKDLRARGITTSTLGVGRDFDETLMRRMAEAGGGGFYYAETARQLADLLTGEVGEALQVVAREAELHIKVPAKTTVRCVNDLPAKTAKGKVVVSLGALVSSQVLELLLEVDLPAGKRGEQFAVELHLADQEGALAQDVVKLAWKAADAKAIAKELPDEDVAKAAAEHIAAEARQRAMAVGRDGAVARAKEILMDAVKALAEEFADIATVTPVIIALTREASRLDRYDSVAYKMASYESYRHRNSRTRDGMTAKRPTR